MSGAAILGLVGCASTDAQTLPSSGATSSAANTAASGTATIAFTYTANSSDGGGRGGVRNPYIAVWIEDSSGALVKTVSLWHLQNGQDRWLNELSEWYQASSGVETNSSATRAPGSYTVAWDLTNAQGAAVADGSYTVCVEALREHGPYSYATGKLAVGAKAVTTNVAANSELSNITVTYVP